MLSLSISHIVNDSTSALTAFMDRSIEFTQTLFEVIACLVNGPELFLLLRMLCMQFAVADQLTEFMDRCLSLRGQSMPILDREVLRSKFGDSILDLSELISLSPVLVPVIAITVRIDGGCERAKLPFLHPGSCVQSLDRLLESQNLST